MTPDIKKAEEILQGVAAARKKHGPKFEHEAVTQAFLESIAYSLLDIAKSLDALEANH